MTSEYGRHRQSTQINHNASSEIQKNTRHWKNTSYGYHPDIIQSFQSL